jgi:hypothetical protein
MKRFDLPRVPEPEVMDDSSEVQAYSSAAADAYLSHIDDTFVEHALRLIGPVPGCALDIGCGPGQILMKLLLRDLLRPSRIRFPFHVRWYGRHYGGLMYKLYCDSVRAAYTSEELSAMLRASGISGARVFTRGSTHLGIERHAHAVTQAVK